ncbi:D-galactarate dehydratase [Yoonia litorea]|uniref:D-galactarate dehydratase n=1 Tax=Yoonia litorea TaxID=1123755 RepID=A0A1I6LSN7_9RHOB|nr:D-galactarate dehydratase [Yoonia litorea]SFS06419.1 hypothetical protein SAMN05444714_0854 [Yoonia litorea]
MRISFLLPIALVAGCSSTAIEDLFATPEPVVETPVATLDPTPPPPPAETARTVDEFDTTTAADREAAVTLASAVDASLGTTLATLGSPTEPGIWLKTPLVSALQSGRVTYQGNTINVELRPSGGVSGSGSQISLAAMRLLNAPLTEIIEVSVAATDS